MGSWIGTSDWDLGMMDGILDSNLGLGSRMMDGTSDGK
jgi:hypothetical protein